MGYAGGGINGALRWRDLALDDLLPVDEAKEEAKRAMQARKMASGTANHNPQPPQHQAPQPMPPDQATNGDDEDDEDDENDENDNEDEDGEDGEDESEADEE
jgi:hypothetical protein